MLSKRTVKLFNVVDRSLFHMGSKLGYARTVEAITRLAESVHDDPTGEFDWSLGEGGSATLDRLLVGAYWFFCDYHGGQNSSEYRALSAIGQVFSPGMSSLEEGTSEEDVFIAFEALFKESKAA